MRGQFFQYGDLPLADQEVAFVVHVHAFQCISLLIRRTHEEDEGEPALTENVLDDNLMLIDSEDLADVGGEIDVRTGWIGHGDLTERMRVAWNGVRRRRWWWMGE